MKKLVLLTMLMMAMSTFGGCSDKPNVQEIARDAINGKKGQLAEWERVAYQLILDKKIEANSSCAITYYYPPETCAYRDAHGNKCTTRTAAANKLPQYSLIWIQGIGLRQVLDTGAKSNDARWAGKKAFCWVDLWEPKRTTTSKSIRKMAIIRWGRG